MTEPSAKRSSALIVLTLLAVLALAGCAPDTVSVPESSPGSNPVETEAPAPEIKAGDKLTAEQAAEINAGTDLIKAYPVGDEFYAVQWGQPIPEPVLKEVNAQVNSGAGAEHGAGTGDQLTKEQALLQKILQAESDKLGGISVAAVQCAMSFSEQSNSFQPTWALTEPAPAGTFGSQAEATSAAQAWADGQVGKRAFVTINELGC